MNGQTNGQEESWDVYMAMYEDDVPGSTTLRMDLIDYAPIAKFPYVIITGVYYQTQREDLLPESESFDMFYQIGDDLIALISKETQIIHAGSFTSNRQRLEYFYVQEISENLQQKIESYYQKNIPNTEFYLNIREDENWEAYLEFLYPNEPTYNYMMDQKVVRRLYEAGDILDKPRRVDYWIYFNNKADVERFQQEVEIEGFQIDSVNHDEEDDFYALQIYKTSPADIDSIYQNTSLLREIAQKHNGDYDGWETFIVKE